MIRTAHKFATRLAGEWLQKPLIPLIMLAILGAVWFFIAIAAEVNEQETRQFDETLLLAMRVPGNPGDPVGPPRIEEMARDLTALGGFTILTGVTLVAFGIALFAGRRRLAWLGLASVLAGSGVMNLLKQTYDRPRPDLVGHAAHFAHASFPSGHTTMSAMVYLTLGILLARTQNMKRVRVFIVAISVFITGLVGISRVYLGVHWPTDVIAGWALGGAWAAIFWLVAMKVDPQLPPAA